MLDFFVQVSVEDLAGLNNAPAVRSKLLQASLDYCDEFISQSRDNPPLQAELAASHLRVAEILDEIGSISATKSALERALEAQERLVRENPGDPELRRSLFAMYQHLGILRGSLSLLLVGGEAVQQHLKLTGGQIAKIDEIREGHERVYREFCDSQSTDLATMRKEYQEYRDVTKEKIVEILNPDQADRLDEIVLQKRGANALEDPDVADELGLTAEQREQLASLQNEAHFPFQPRGPGRMRGRFGTLDERYEEVLTPTQQQKWKEMTGEPFDGVGGGPGGRFFGMRGRPIGRKPPSGPR
jgi:hypothetical protein